MQNSILDNFSDLILAVKDDEKLKQKLLDICKLPIQQRIVELEKFRFENPGIPLTSVLQLFRNDLITKEVAKYLSGEKTTESEYQPKSQPEKKNFLLIIIISLLLIIILLLVAVLFLSKKDADIKDDSTNISSIVVPPNYKQSVLIDYQKIISESNPELRKKLIEKFLSDFPNSDYAEEVRVKYLKTLFQLKDYNGISTFLKTNMDFNSKAFFQKIDVLIENKYYDETKRLVAEQLTLNYDETVKTKLKIYLADIYFYDQKTENAIRTYFDILKNHSLTDSQTSKIFFNLSKIYSLKNDNSNLVKTLNGLIESSSNIQFKTLGMMMLAEYCYFSNNPAQTESLCKKIKNAEDQKISYFLFNEKIHTSHYFADFLLNRLKQ